MRWPIAQKCRSWVGMLVYLLNIAFTPSIIQPCPTNYLLHLPSNIYYTFLPCLPIKHIIFSIDLTIQFTYQICHSLHLLCSIYSSTQFTFCNFKNCQKNVKIVKNYKNRKIISNGQKIEMIENCLNSQKLSKYFKK